jgi:hypothetical protein
MAPVTGARRHRRRLGPAVAALAALCFSPASGRAATAGFVWTRTLSIREQAPPPRGNTSYVDVRVGGGGRALITWSGNAEGGLEAALGTTRDGFGRAVLLARAASLAARPVIDASGTVLVPWEQLTTGRLMLSIAPAGRGFERPVSLAVPAHPLLWNMTGSRAGPVMLEWVKRTAGTPEHDVMYAATVAADGSLSAPRELASGRIRGQRVATDDRGDIAVIWSLPYSTPVTYLTLCLAAGPCHTEAVRVSPPFGTVALLPNGTALVAGSRDLFGGGVSVALCPMSGPCERPEVLTRTGAFPHIAVDPAGRATLAWQDDQTRGGFLNSAALSPGSTRFFAARKVRSRIGGLDFSLAVNGAGAVLAGWAAADPAARFPILTSFAAPRRRLTAAVPVPGSRHGRAVVYWSDPSVGIDDSGNAVVAWSTGGFGRTTVHVALGHPTGP